MGRISKLVKDLKKQCNIECIAPTGSFPCDESNDDADLRQWWKRDDTNDLNLYRGLEHTTIPQLMRLWEDSQEDAPAFAFLGFSQGARLVHLCCVLHNRQPETYFKGLSCVLLISGYDAPMESSIPRWCPGPPNKDNMEILDIPSLHIWGETDRLVTPEQSKANLRYYRHYVSISHPGGHHVPMQAQYRKAIMDFVASHLDDTERVGDTLEEAAIPAITTTWPDEETKQLQQEEVEALQAIYPDQIKLDREDLEVFPIAYTLLLVPPEEQEEANGVALWPPQPLVWHVQYPATYPSSTGEGRPRLSWRDTNNVFQFSSAQRAACDAAVQQAINEAAGMPCVFAAYTAVQDFFENGGLAEHAGSATTTAATTTSSVPDAVSTEQPSSVEEEDTATTTHVIPSALPERIAQCHQQGLDIAASILSKLGKVDNASNTIKGTMVTGSQLVDTFVPSSDDTTAALGKGGSWNYTIGLVGKPSAGKSTFFNAATAFARQRNDADNVLGGASMAPHPFTTIDPNVGYCLVPAPHGLCPEDDMNVNSSNNNATSIKVGSTHGRDAQERRLLPVLLKDVAGLVPGAYQGRGRGNKFLNDLTDADVLVHVLDASATADVEGNDLGMEVDGTPSEAASHPLQDMEWIRKELIEWVHSNLMYKWQSVTRKGRSKLEGMFSGYGQNNALLTTILNAVEKYMQVHDKMDHPLENIHLWDEGDVHRLVSAFLGVRFPMVLALNKSDLPTSAKHIDDILAALPVHGAYAGTPLCARKEMLVIKGHLECSLGSYQKNETEASINGKMTGVASCLTSALSVREPVLVFPVMNFDDYSPLPSLSRYATSDPSLPNVGMLSYLRASGGQVPTLWNADTMQYVEGKQKNSGKENALRDVLVMKPGSTVDDVFVALKNRRALEGDFVRAEAAAYIGAPSRPVPKFQPLAKSNRILRIMTTKKVAWQQKQK
jgi:ribosome-binding ATPase YchF (GTP1/OBG family)